MTEKEKILKLLENHKDLFKATDMDVFESVKGQWFFTRYNSEFDYFDAIATFKTAEELARIILGEISADLFVTIDGCSEDTFEYTNLVDDVIEADDYQENIDRLLEYLSK